MNTKEYLKNYHYMTQEQRDLKRRRAKRIYQLRKRVALFSIAVIMILSISLIAGNTRSKAENRFNTSLSVTYQSIMVQAGDTLWSIAEEQTANIAELSCKEYVSIVKELNRLGSEKLRYGEYIIIPVYSYTNHHFA